MKRYRELRMVSRITLTRVIFLGGTYLVFLLIVVCGLYPFIHVVALSLSARTPAIAGDVTIWPLGWNVESYVQMLNQSGFGSSLLMTGERLVIGVGLNFFLIIILAYPLSKETKRLHFRNLYAWFFVITMLFHGGLVPWYLTIKSFHLLNTVWALTLPTAVPVFSVLLVMNFFRGLPKELEEAALMDGADHWQILWRIFVPISTASLATVTLFSFVGHWNSWFDGLILMNSLRKYPLQSFMQTFIIQSDVRFFSSQLLESLKYASESTMKSALIVIGALPVVLIFPLVQRFLAKGIVLGSVKG